MFRDVIPSVIGNLGVINVPYTSPEEAAAPKETKEATSDVGFVSAKKVSKVQKVVDKERINTQKKLPEFMLKESDPIKRMKYKTGLNVIGQ